MKNTSVVLAAVLVVVCFVLVFLSAQTVAKTKKILDQERYHRMVTEEKLEKVSSELISLKNEMTNSQNQTQSIQTVLEQERLANTNLRAELEKMTRLKEVLERELKNALTESKSTPPRSSGP